MRKVYTRKLIDKEVRNLKLTAAICLGFGLIIVSTMSSFYWNLYEQSYEYD